MDTDLSYFIERLRNAETEEESWEALLGYYQGRGVDFVHWCFGMNMVPDELKTTCPDWWMDFYMEHQCQGADRIVDHYLGGAGTMVYGIDRQGRNPAQPEEFTRLLNVGRHYLGTATGLAFPVILPSGKRVGGINLGLEGDLEELAKRPPGHLADLCMAAQSTYTRMYLLRSFGLERAELTLRERECMQFLAQGLRTKEISEKLTLSDATVLFHLNNAKDKLGAQTRDQALARAMMLGLIDP